MQFSFFSNNISLNRERMKEIYVTQRYTMYGHCVTHVTQCPLVVDIQKVYIIIFKIINFDLRGVLNSIENEVKIA